MNTIHRIILRGAALGLVAAAGLITLVASNGGDDTDTQGYTLAFPGGGGIQVRSSVEGRTWTDGDFPQDVGQAMGVAMAATPNKLMYSALWRDADQQIRMLRGLGPDAWESAPIAQVPEERARSAPSATFTRDGLWAIAYRAEREPPNPSFGDRVVLRLFDTSVSPPVYLPGNRFGYPGYDTHAAGRPAVTYVGDTLLLVWQTGPQPSATLHLGTGTVTADGISWHERTDLPSGCGTVRSDPVVTHDHHGFQLGFLCQDNGLPEYLARLRVLRSSNGRDWSLYGKWEQAIALGAQLGLAGRSDGSLIAAARWLDQQNLIAARCAGDDACMAQGDVVWETIDATDMFGGIIPTGPFALIATGEPAEQ